MKFIILVILLSNIVFALDNDFDGVEDNLDKCLYSKFTDIVDKDGCKTKSLVSNHHFDIVLGYKNSSDSVSDTTTVSQKIGYYYDDISLALYSSQYDYISSSNTNLNGNDDYYFATNYKIRQNSSLSYSLGVGASIPSSSSSTNKNDYTVSSSIYKRFNKRINLFTGISYTIVNDIDINTTTYQNTYAYYLGSSYNLFYNTNISLLYNTSVSKYQNNEDINTAYLSLSYYINAHWFTQFSFSKQINMTTPNAATSLKIGYYF